jgi:hypothetical protein
LLAVQGCGRLRYGGTIDHPKAAEISNVLDELKIVMLFKAE